MRPCHPDPLFILGAYENSPRLRSPHSLAEQLLSPPRLSLFQQQQRPADPRLEAGESYQDKADAQHTIFRNPDAASPLKYLFAYTVKKGQPYLIIP
jgi:hypothetical protein